MSVYTSKIDSWLLAVLLGVAGACVFEGVRMVNARPSGWMGAVFLVLVGIGFPLWLLLSTRYILTTTELQVRGGPFRWNVPLNAITHVAPTRSLVSSPALSLDRLRINYGRGRSIIISPKDKEAFLRDLEERRSALRQ